MLRGRLELAAWLRSREIRARYQRTDRKLPVRLIDQTAILELINAIGKSMRKQAMRRQKDRGSGSSEIFKHSTFGLFVQRRCSLIQQHQTAAAQNRPCQTQSLPLSS